MPCHDMAGGNDLMIVKGNWSNQYSGKEIEWKANGDMTIKEGMINWKNKIQQDHLKWIRDTQ